MRLIMENKSGVRKKVKEGFSWTTFFFGWIPSLMRGDVISALKILILGSITLGIYTAFKSRTINRDYKEFLLEKGYEEIDIEEGGMPSCGVLEGCFVGARVGITVLLPIIMIMLSFFAIKGGIEFGQSNFIINSPEKIDAGVSNTQNTKIQASSSGEEVASKVSTENSKQEVSNSNIDKSIYKSSVTKKQLEADYDKYNNVLSGLSITYGTAYKDYGLIFEGNETKEQQENNLKTVNEYFKNLDDALNEQWASIKNVLNENVFKELQKEQVKWIKERDKIAKEKSANASEDFKNISFIMYQGKETEIRIRELNNEYLNPKNIK
ncbi:MAG: lysozyme inhibitor LprI family protein [Sarcina sp.]